MIKTFVWSELKYSTKKSLAELTAVITKVRFVFIITQKRKCASSTSRSRDNRMK